MASLHQLQKTDVATDGTANDTVGPLSPAMFRTLESLVERETKFIHHPHRSTLAL